jgi:uncharacterized protein (TIGR00730 family)
MLERFKREYSKKHFRVTIFGSARIKKNDKTYKAVKSLAKNIGEEGWDLVTGGGHGLMGAATAGHMLGDKKNRADAIGLTIRLPWEVAPNKQLEVQKYFKDFSGRLDTFMKLSDVVVVTPGGIGTCLELFYTWQLLQVKHLMNVPIIVVGKMWEELIKWSKKYPLKAGLISPENFNHIHVAKNYDQVHKLIKKYYKLSPKFEMCEKRKKRNLTKKH